MTDTSQNVLQKTPSFMRKNVPCNSLEEMAETAAAVWGMAGGVTASHPVELNDVDKVFLEP